MTPAFKRKPSKYLALKKAKELEIYTIKKVNNTEYFTKKKYRKELKDVICSKAISVYTLLAKAYYKDDETILKDATIELNILMAQIEVANSLYTTQIGGIEYWSNLIVETKDAIIEWMKSLK